MDDYTDVDHALIGEGEPRQHEPIDDWRAALHGLSNARYKQGVADERHRIHVIMTDMLRTHKGELAASAMIELNRRIRDGGHDD